MKLQAVSAVAMGLVLIAAVPASAQVVEVAPLDRSAFSTSIEAANVVPIFTINFDVAPGAVVPDTVELQPMTEKGAELFPPIASFQYFLTPLGKIVVVDPANRTIVQLM